MKQKCSCEASANDRLNQSFVKEVTCLVTLLGLIQTATFLDSSQYPCRLEDMFGFTRECARRVGGGKHHSGNINPVGKYRQSSARSVSGVTETPQFMRPRQFTAPQRQGIRPPSLEIL